MVSAELKEEAFEAVRYAVNATVDKSIGWQTGKVLDIVETAKIHLGGILSEIEIVKTIRQHLEEMVETCNILSGLLGANVHESCSTGAHGFSLERTKVAEAALQDWRDTYIVQNRSARSK